MYKRSNRYIRNPDAYLHHMAEDHTIDIHQTDFLEIDTVVYLIKFHSMIMRESFCLSRQTYSITSTSHTN